MASGPASAQSPLGSTNAWLITPMLGVAVDGDANKSLTVAGALGYPITRSLAVEGELGHVFDLAPDDANVDASLTTVHGSALYFFDTSYVATPYVAAGLGVAKFSRDVQSPKASADATEMGFNLGGGITYPLNDRAWVRGDVRVFKHIDNVPTVWRFAAAVTVRLSD